MIKYEIQYTVVKRSGVKLTDQKFEIELDDGTCNFDAIFELKTHLKKDGYMNFWCQEIESTEGRGDPGIVLEFKR